MCFVIKLYFFQFIFNVGDSFSQQNGAMFSSKDFDNDQSAADCAKLYNGGWWYSNCHDSNLNGLYLQGNNISNSGGVIWKQWKGDNYSLKKTEMKIRRI